MPHQLWIVAGPNGSGKTTLTRQHLTGRLPVINPDDIAKSLNFTHPEDPATAFLAGRRAVALQKKFIAERRTFAVETTFSGNREIMLMKQAKAAGYKVNLVFVCIETPRVSIARIADRVTDGGHHVPGADVTRRYQRGLANLPEGLALADRAWLLDNSRSRMRLVAAIERNQVKTMINALPRWVKTARLPALEQAQGLSR